MTRSAVDDFFEAILVRNVVARAAAAEEQEEAEEQTKTAGFGYGVMSMYFLFVSMPKRPKPFNIDVIQAINQTWIPAKGDDGEMHDVNLHFVDSKSGGSLSHIQEKQGFQSETLVEVRIPKGAERAAFKGMVDVGKKVGLLVEPAKGGYQPQRRPPT